MALVQSLVTETPLHTCCAQSLPANALCAQQTCQLRYSGKPIRNRRSVSLIVKKLVFDKRTLLRSTKPKSFDVVKEKT